MKLQKYLSFFLSIIMMFTAFIGQTAVSAEEAGDVCEIDGIGYETLADALAMVEVGQTVTIKLLNTIHYYGGITINKDDNKNITFDLSGYNLNIVNDSGPGLSLASGSVKYVDITGVGQLNVTGTTGVTADNATAAVTYATGTERYSSGAYALNKGRITVAKDAVGQEYGAWADGTDTTITIDGDSWAVYGIGAYSSRGGNIVVNGGATGQNSGAFAQRSLSRVTVFGDATATGSSGGTNAGASAERDGTVVIYGNAVASSSDGVYVAFGGKVEVSGNVTAGRYGVYALGNPTTGEDGRAYISGNVTASVFGVFAKDGGKIGVGGNVTATGGSGAYCVEGDITIGGNAQGTYNGVTASIRRSSITVRGDVIATGPEGTGAMIANYGMVTATTDICGNIFIDGNIQTQKDYISVNNVKKDGSPGSRDPISGRAGYYSYSAVNPVPSVTDGSNFAVSTVWVKETSPAGTFEVRDASELEAALSAIKDGNTIRLLQNITYPYGIVIKGNKNITLDLNGKTLNVINEAGEGLFINENSHLGLSGGGEFNVTGETGVNAANSSSVTVTSAVGTSGNGAHATLGGKVTVIGNASGTEAGAYAAGADSEVTIGGNAQATGTGLGGYGVYARGGSIIVGGNASAAKGPGVYCVMGRVEVTGSVTGTNVGAIASASDSTIIIHGNLAATNTNGIGARSDANGTITVDGVITAGNGMGIYIQIFPIDFDPEDGIADLAKPGYLKYSDGSAIVWVKNNLPHTYTLTVENGSGGGSYMAGTQVNITADAPPSGKVFDIWTTDNGGTFADAASSNTIFTMPASAVTVKATYRTQDVLPIMNYTIAASAGSGGDISPNGNVTVPKNENKTFTIIPDNNYRIFSVVVDGVNQGAISSYTFSNVIEDHSISAEFSYVGGGGGSGSGIGTLIYSAEVITDGIKGYPLPVVVDTASNTVMVNLGLGKAKELFKSGSVVIVMPSIPGVNAYTLELPAETLSDLQGKDALTLSTGLGSFIITADWLKGIPGTEGKKVGITIGKGDWSSLPGEVMATVGDRPIVELSLTLDGVKTKWSNPGIPMTIRIPYTPTTAELADAEYIVVWHIGSSNGIPIPSGRYDPITREVIFTATHFGHYVVNYVHKTFSDLDVVEWAKTPIEVLASKGIISGTAANTYAPVDNIKRADYLVMLTETLGLTADFDNNFEDVKADAYYYKAVGTAKKLGITMGAGDNRFNPNENISRQDMMVLTARALEKYKGFRVTDDFHMLDRYADKKDIAGYALSSLCTLTKENLIQGTSSRLNPCALATRAEAAVFLYRVYHLYFK